MKTLEELGYKITHSSSCPVMHWGKYYIYASKVVDGVLDGLVAGYGDDEGSAIQYAIKTLENLR